jgi:hypothetical protein
MSEQTKVAVAVIVGIGKGDQDDYQNWAIGPLQERCREQIGDGAVLELVHWTPILRAEKDRLYEGYQQIDDLNFPLIRRFFVGLITNVIGYQPQGEESDIYLGIHRKVAEALDRLSRRAGPDAPLVIIAHSLGAVIASNYLRELQDDTYKSELLPEEVYDIAGDTPLERGETLAQVYTMGTPLALYSVRHREFDDPMKVPSSGLSQHYPPDRFPDIPTCWINFYNSNDVLAFPLSFLNDAYNQVVEDREVNVGGLLRSWNPFSHMEYWGAAEVVDPIADGIIRLHAAVNP